MPIQVTIARNDVDLAANLFVPAGFDPTQEYVAVVVQGSLTSVKEQMPASYARRLADHGFVALTFDYSHYGRSTGTPRQLECPSEKLLDLQAVLTHLLAQPYVSKVAMVGVCTSAGNAAYLAAADPRLAAVATVAGMLPEPALFEALYGADGVAARRQRALDADTTWTATGQQTLVPAYSETDPSAVNYNPAPGAYDYYLNPARGGIPEYTNALDVASLHDWLEFDPISQAAAITIPALIVHSNGSAFPEQAKRFHDLLAGPKEMAWLEGNHFDFYDSATHIDNAVRTVSAFLNDRLTA